MIGFESVAAGSFRLQQFVRKHPIRNAVTAVCGNLFMKSRLPSIRKCFSQLV